jgi:glycosyltransferase involved in cell wall biosynthesis
MRITYVSHSTIPSRSANSVHVMKMCNAFSQLGHDVELLAPTRNDMEPIDNDIYAHYGVPESFRLTRLPQPSMPGGYYAYALMVKNRLRKTDPDVVYARYLPGCYAAARTGHRSVFEAHNPVQEDGRIHDRLFRRLLGRPELARIVVISDSLRRKYLQDYPMKESLLVTAHDGADAAPSTEPVGPARRRERPQVGYVGHLYPGKGMEVITQLARLRPGMDFHVVGGKQEDIDAWRRRTSGLHNLHYHGHVSHKKAQHLMRGFDVLLAPYQSQVGTNQGRRRDIARWMSPLKIFEYMATGRPIIASDLPVLQEVLTDHKNALLRHPRDMPGWTDALDTLVEDPDLGRQIAAAAREDLLHGYTWESRARRVLAGMDT